MKNQFESIIFDLDGTLLNTLDDLADSMNFVLQNHGYKPHLPDAYKDFISEGLRQLVEQALPQEARSEIEIRTLMEEMMTAYQKNLLNKTRLYPEIDELLTELTLRKINLNILSNKEHDQTCILCNELLFNWRFNVIFGSRENIPKKPHPQAVFEICKLNNISVSDCIFVGDTKTDMKTAQNASMFSVGVTWGFRDKKELQEHNARLIIDSPLELLQLWQKK